MTVAFEDIFHHRNPRAPNLHSESYQAGQKRQVILRREEAVELNRIQFEFALSQSRLANQDRLSGYDISIVCHHASTLWCWPNDKSQTHIQKKRPWVKCQQTESSSPGTQGSLSRTAVHSKKKSNYKAFHLQLTPLIEKTFARDLSL